MKDIYTTQNNKYIKNYILINNKKYLYYIFDKKNKKIIKNNIYNYLLYIKNNKNIKYL